MDLVEVVDLPFLELILHLGAPVPGLLQIGLEVLLMVVGLV